MYTKGFYWQKGFDSFEAGKRIAAWNPKTWQRIAYKAGYEYAKLRSLVWADDPNQYQIERLKAIIVN